MTITINNQTFDLTKEQEAKLRNALNLNQKRLSDVAIGDTFKIGDIEFIKFEEENGRVSAVTKDILFTSKFDNNTNNFAKSSLAQRLVEEILPKIEAYVGADNVLEFETDLTSLDGLNDYSVLASKVSLPTFDFYRKHVKIFDKYKVNNWWWLATPDSTPTHGIEMWVRYVNDGGTLNYDNCRDEFGVRPFFIFESSIFVS